MTTDDAIGRRGEESLGSVRHRLAAVPRERWALLGVLGLVVVVHGWRVLRPFYVGGDLLYHWGLTHTILLGSFPPQGPYLGLPVYYPPGFHLLLAGVASIPGLDVPSATVLLSILWLPVIPLGAYLLARRLSGRGDVALVAAALTAFAGGFDLGNDRLWVNSMFMVGQVAFPMYPRDLVFGILPFAVLAYLRATDGGRRWLGWALVAGGLLGLCALIQVQLLLPIPFALAVVAIARAWRERGRWLEALGALVVTGVASAALVAPWLAYIAGIIRTNGGVSIASSDDLLPVRIGFWDYPLQFGLILPLAVVGAGVVLLFLLRPDGPRPEGRLGTWAPRPVEGPLVLLPWWIVAFALAVLYQPSWPLEDALRPQRMWLISSQPALILAAMGLIALAEAIVAAPRSRVRRAVPLVVAAVLVASIPTTLATTRLMASTWTDARYAHLRLGLDRVPAMDELLDIRGPRPTILTYEDWSSLAWYETGVAVVAVEPPGYAKLAFDPAAFTGHGQAERRSDLAAALRGDVNALVATADRYGADRIVLARRGTTLGLIGQPAVSAATAGGVAGTASVLQGNGWDAEVLQPGAILTIPVSASGPIDLEVRILTGVGADPAATDGATPDPWAPPAGSTATRFRLVAGDTAVELAAAPVPGEAFTVVTASIDLPAGAGLRLEAIDPVTVQSITGFVPDPGPPAGWSIGSRTDDAVVWQRTR
ncbi:MAG: hypothetical protein ABI562_05680 [Chloroflexota bacterium]